MWCWTIYLRAVLWRLCWRVFEVATEMVQHRSRKGLIFHLTGFLLEMPLAVQFKRDTSNPGVQTLVDLGIQLI